MCAATPRGTRLCAGDTAANARSEQQSQRPRLKKQLEWLKNNFCKSCSDEGSLKEAPRGPNGRRTGAHTLLGNGNGTESKGLAGRGRLGSC